MTNKQIKEELKQVVKNLCNIEFTVEDELKLYKEALKRKEQECEKLKAKIEYIFSDDSSNFDYFCDICVAKDKCNQNCCFEQIKELIYEVE